MEDQIFVQHRFTVEKDGLTLSDAIVIPLSEYTLLSDNEIEDMKQERFDNFKEKIENPIQEEKPTKEDLLVSIEKDIVSLEQEWQRLVSQKAELNNGGK